MKKSYHREALLTQLIPPKNRVETTLLALFMILVLSSSSFAQITNAMPGVIGSGSEITGVYPINSCYSYSYSQQIYLASELQQALVPGNNYITKIKFNQIDSPIGGGANYKDWVVYLKNTAQSSFASDSDWETNLSEVFDGVVAVDNAGWIEITLQDPFLWDGTSNIVVGVDENTLGYYTHCDTEWSAFETGSARGLYFYDDNINPDPAALPTAISGLSTIIAQVAFESVPVPNCIMPAQLSVSNYTSNSVVVSWTSDAAFFELEYGPQGFLQGEGQGQLLTQIENNYTLNGLQISTPYSYYVRANCGNETSTWSGPYNFTIQYCIPTTNFEGDYIQQFSTTNAAQNVNYSTADYDGDYHNLQDQILVQAQGMTFNFADAYYEGGHTLNIWIDWNKDLAFSEDELIYADYTDQVGQNGSIEIPIDAELGTYVMRVRGAYSQNTVTPCTELQYGSAIDFTLQVTPAPLFFPPTNLAVSNITLDQATLAWTGTTSSYEYIIKTVNETPTAEDAVDAEVEVTSVDFANLNVGTNYYFWVRSVTSETEKSDYTFVSFKTISIGSSCEAPLVVNTFPYNVTSSTCGMGNNYGEQCDSNYGEGEDMVFQLNITELGMYTFNLTSLHEDSYIGWFLKDANGCSVESECLAYATTDQGSFVSDDFNFEQPGIYYLIIDTYPSPYCSDFELEIRKSCAGQWTGAEDNDWHNPANWCGNIVPDENKDVIVEVENPLVLSSIAVVQTLHVGANANVRIDGLLAVFAEITVAPGGIFTVSDLAEVFQGPDSELVPNTGLTTVEKNSSLLWRQDYTLWSSPVSGQNLRGFSPETVYNRFYSYNTEAGANGDYFQEISTTADMNTKLFDQGKGYLIRMPNNWVEVTTGNPAEPFLGKFKGVLNNGTISAPLSGANTGMNLVGNPYPSGISIEAFFAVNSPNIQPLLYFWNKPGSAAQGNTGSGYLAYNFMGSNESAEPIVRIEKGQGFFVVAANGEPEDLIYSNFMRIPNDAIYATKSAASTMEMHRYWLRLSNATNPVGSTLIGYATGATQGVDNGFDAVYFNDSQLALTSLINNVEYSIQGRGLPFVDTDVVSLGFKSDVAGSYTISLSNFDGLFAENQDIFLKDNATNTLQNLKVGAYTFTTQTGVFNDRFEVQYTSTLATANPTFDANAILVAVKNQQITINAGAVTMSKIELIDVSGRVIYTSDEINATVATIDNVTASNQMLIVRITTAENAVVNQKIVF